MITFPMKTNCFKAYDVRGRLPDQLNAAIVYRIGRAYVDFTEAKTVVVGHDMRLSSPELTEALIEGLTDAGCHVRTLGLCGTEQVYFATFHYGFDGGIMVTASHNPADYNGLKFVRQQSRPISADTGLKEIQQLVETADYQAKAATLGRVSPLPEAEAAYIEHLLSYVDVAALKPLRLVANAGNGCAGPIMEKLAPHLPFAITKVFYEPDGHFPNGIPNPMLPERREDTVKALAAVGNADFAMAWDGDFDRCFFFDGQGRFIEGYYLVGLLAQAFLEKSPGSAIVYDPRLLWNTEAIIAQGQGIAIKSKAGHAFIKDTMRQHDAVYGGEMSAHHYFRDFAYCDSGMIPWLLLAEQLSKSGKTLAEWIDARQALFPCSGEINFTVADAQVAIAKVHAHFSSQNPALDSTDGLGLDFGTWRFNLRASNTEPVIRLNVESRGDSALVWEKVEEIKTLLL
jgi:phosphomannomutase